MFSIATFGSFIAGTHFGKKAILWASKSGDRYVMFTAFLVKDNNDG
jgi:hypothetical protein